jgi:hypothetical protein
MRSILSWRGRLTPRTDHADERSFGVRWQSVAPTPLSEGSAGGREAHKKPVILSAAPSERR